MLHGKSYKGLTPPRMAETQQKNEKRELQSTQTTVHGHCSHNGLRHKITPRLKSHNTKQHSNTSRPWHTLHRPSRVIVAVLSFWGASRSAVFCAVVKAQMLDRRKKASPLAIVRTHPCGFSRVINQLARNRWQ